MVFPFYRLFCLGEVGGVRYESEGALTPCHLFKSLNHDVLRWLDYVVEEDDEAVLVFLGAKSISDVGKSRQEWCHSAADKYVLPYRVSYRQEPFSVVVGFNLGDLNLVRITVPVSPVEHEGGAGIRTAELVLDGLLYVALLFVGEVARFRELDDVLGGETVGDGVQAVLGALNLGEDVVDGAVVHRYRVDV